MRIIKLILELLLDLVSDYIIYAKDEKQKDLRDLSIYESEEFAGTGYDGLEFEKFPEEFILNDGRFQNQGKTNKCTAYSFTNAVNTSLWIQADKKTFYKGDDLANEMFNQGKMTEKGAYVIDAIKIGKKIGMCDSYYQVDTIQEIMWAIYNFTAPICTGSTKINRGQIKYDGLVTDVSRGSGHAFEITGWSKTKKIGPYTGGFICENSYGKDYQDKGYFWIPFDLTFDIIFNTRKAIKVLPKWKKEKLNIT